MSSKWYEKEKILIDRTTRPSSSKNDNNNDDDHKEQWLK